MFQCDGISDDGSLSEPLTPTAEDVPSPMWPDNSCSDYVSSREKLEFGALQEKLKSTTVNANSLETKIDTHLQDNETQKHILESSRGCSIKPVDSSRKTNEKDHSNSITCTQNGKQSHNSNKIDECNLSTDTGANVDFPWPWYILFIVCCEFWGNASYMDPIWFVCYVASMCFISFVLAFPLSSDK